MTNTKADPMREALQRIIRLDPNASIGDPPDPQYFIRQAQGIARDALASAPRSSCPVCDGAFPCNDAIKHMVNRFLGWKLPEDFNPDAGISFKATFNEHTAHPMKHEPTGTNLFDVTQTHAMVRYMVDGLATIILEDSLMPDLDQIEQTSPDPLVDYLTKILDEARFRLQPDGDMWCSDSNASIDPHQLAKDIRELLAKEPS